MCPGGVALDANGNCPESFACTSDESCGGSQQGTCQDSGACECADGFSGTDCTFELAGKK